MPCWPDSSRRCGTVNDGWSRARSGGDRADRGLADATERAAEAVRGFTGCAALCGARLSAVRSAVVLDAEARAVGVRVHVVHGERDPLSGDALARRLADGQRFVAYKLSKRFDQDISAVVAAREGVQDAAQGDAQGTS